MARIAILLVVLVLSAPAGAPAQALLPPLRQPEAALRPAWQQHAEPADVGIMEHADGGEPLVVAGFVALTGLAAYDIFTAPASARRFNERHPDAERKSPGTALLLSAAATAVPMAIGGLAFDQGAEEAGAPIALLGVALGPSAGHWYAGERRRALATAGIRTALVLFTGVVYGCCT